MCIDHRKQLRLPKNFSYIIRAAGANLNNSEFDISYAIAVGEVNTIALIGHSNCGMVELATKRDQFIQGLVQRAGWEKDAAEKHFLKHAPRFEIENEIDFILSEAKRLRLCYPSTQVAPLFFKVEDNLLYLIREGA